MCELGATDDEVAKALGVCVRTLYRWQSQHPEFCQALKAGKEVADNRIERALYHKAAGYTYDSEKIFQNNGEVVRVKITEHVPPDTTAMIFWLKNRRPDLWRDKREVDQTVKREAVEFSDAELEDIIRRGSEGAAKPQTRTPRSNKVH